MTEDTPAESGAERAAARYTADAPAPVPDPLAASTLDGAGRATAPGPADAMPPAAAETRRRGRTPRARRKASFWRELPILLVVALVLAVLIKTFLVQAFFIPSSSMERTLHGCPGCHGDRVLVNKLTYRFHDPRPGDVVVFRGPESWAPEVHIEGPSNILQRGVRAVGQVIGIAQPNEKDFIKRVIAVGGQTVQCCDPQGRVIVDGRPLDEPYIYLDGQQDLRLAQFGPVQVPAGRLWVMGDHRNASADSRAHIADSDRGTISVHDVIGKAFVIVWPPSRWHTLGTPSTFASLGPLSPSTPLVVALGVVFPLRLAGRRQRLRLRRRGWLRHRAAAGRRP
jgi:signal peptidase I